MIPLSICKEGVVLVQIALRNSSFYMLEIKQTLLSLGEKYFIEKDVFSVNDTSDSEETNPSTSSRRRTYDLLVTSPDAQPLNYRRLMGAAAIRRKNSFKLPKHFFTFSLVKPVFI